MKSAIDALHFKDRLKHSGIAAFALLFFLNSQIGVAGDLGDFGRCLIARAKGQSYYENSLPDQQVIKKMGSAARATLPGKNLKISIWNTYKGHKPGLKTDFQDLMSASDLSLLQEVKTEDGDTSIYGSKTRAEWNVARSFKTPQQNYLGVATGSVASATEVDFKRSASREPISGTQKMALVTKYPVDAGGGKVKSLLTVNIHAINFVGASQFELQLLSLEKEISNHDGPVIFGGDFNVWGMKRKRMLEEFIVRAGLQRVNIVGAGKNQWDLAFVKGLKVRSASLLKNVESSDHSPIFLAVDVE